MAGPSCARRRLKRRQAQTDTRRTYRSEPVSASFSHPPFMPCPECGASVAVATETEHVCNPGRRLDYELFQLREEISGLEAEVEGYLSSAEGRFEQWYAEHKRRPPHADDPSAEEDDPPGA